MGFIGSTYRWGWGLNWNSPWPFFLITTLGWVPFFQRLPTKIPGLEMFNRYETDVRSVQNFWTVRVGPDVRSDSDLSIYVRKIFGPDRTYFLGKMLQFSLFNTINMTTLISTKQLYTILLLCDSKMYASNKWFSWSDLTFKSRHSTIAKPNRTSNTWYIIVVWLYIVLCSDWFYDCNSCDWWCNNRKVPNESVHVLIDSFLLHHLLGIILG